MIIIITMLVSLTMVAAHGSGAWLDLKHHNRQNIYSGMRVRQSNIRLIHANPEAMCCGVSAVRIRERSQIISHRVGRWRIMVLDLGLLRRPWHDTNPF